MGQDDESATRQAAFADYAVTADLMAHADGAHFLHCLPAIRDSEVAADVIDGPASAVWQQAANRMHTARGALAWMVGIRP
jgi:ornithine carbamoyltransferase